MNIRDIVNREIVTLTNCEHEPIHIPGSIQPHGFLLGLTKENFSIVFCSGNVDQFIGLSHQQLLGKDFELLFGKNASVAVKDYIRKSDHPFAQPLSIELHDKAFGCLVQTINVDIYILEFEPVTDSSMAATDVYRQTAQFTSYLQKAGTLQDLCQLVADETRIITGYDRVMIYRFDEHYNGEVFAESREARFEPFFGLHYPHTDIPVQARELYMKNLLRLIVDVKYTPVPLYTNNASATHKALDLSISTLRSVSPIHIQYLHNMGVGATLTLSLLHEGKLWGLIACHHYSPKYLPYDARMAAQLQAHFLTSQISVRQLAEEYAVAQKVNKDADELLSTVFANENTTLEDIARSAKMLSATSATGIAIMVEDSIFTNGLVPSDDALRKLAQWLSKSNKQDGFNTAKLSVDYPEAANWCGLASGLVYHSLGVNDGRNGFLLFREEILREVNWAGNPEKAIEKDANGLSPRKSFALWKETKACESSPWLKPELSVAATIAHALQRFIYLLHLRREEQRQRQLSEKLRKANAELENINWIGSHDLKEPLRKIQVFASRILGQEDDTDKEQIIEYVERMNKSANRMQTLISDMLAYSKLDHIQEGITTINLESLVKNILDELQTDIEQTGAVIEVGHLPQIKGVPVLVRQLFVNLLSNSFKFSKPDTSPHIAISAASTTLVPPGEKKSARFHRIAIADNGIGFDEAYKNDVFQVFKKLHYGDQHEGTGIGLALSKKIMQNHGGFIDATSKINTGTTFCLYFPQE